MRVASGLAHALREEDVSSNATVIEYAVRQLFKGKSIKAAAAATARQLSGKDNLFLGLGSTIDPKALEQALWGRIVDTTIKNMQRMKEGMQHMALEGTLEFFQQPTTLRSNLKASVVQRLGHDPFVNDQGVGA